MAADTELRPCQAGAALGLTVAQVDELGTLAVAYLAGYQAGLAEQPPSTGGEHRCDGTDGEDTACIDGTLYGPCSSEHCGGVCEYVGACGCACHRGGTVQS